PVARPPSLTIRPTNLTILHLVANRWWTGSADPVLRLLEGLRRRGHRPLLGGIPGDRFEVKAREAGLSPLSGLSLDRGADPLTLARDVRRLRRVVRDERVDLIHTHHSHDHWLALLARPRGLPLVRTFHNARSVRGGPLDRRLYRRTAAFFAVSRGIETRCRA